MLARALAAGLLLAQASAQLGFNYTAYPCAPQGLNGKNLITGNKAYVCVTINGRSTAVFTPSVDSFTAIQLSSSNIAVPEGAGLLQDKAGWIPSVQSLASTNCSDPLRSRNYFVTFDVRSYNVQSPYPKIYKNLTFDDCPASEEPFWGGPVNVVETIPVYTAIIGLVDGNIEYIDWDEGCYFCASNGPECGYNTFDVNASTPILSNDLRNCKRTEEFCYATPTPTPSANTGGEEEGGDASPSPTVSANVNATVNATSNPCDLKIYVVWAGTDANGRFLTSAGRRFSRFRQYGTSSLYQGAVNIIDDSINMAQTAVNYVQTLPGRLSPDNVAEERRLGLHFGNVGADYSYLSEEMDVEDDGLQPPDTLYTLEADGAREINLRGRRL